MQPQMWQCFYEVASVQTWLMMCVNIISIHYKLAGLNCGLSARCCAQLHCPEPVAVI